MAAAAAAAAAGPRAQQQWQQFHVLQQQWCGSCAVGALRVVW